jgi:DNA polymerase-3 subunit gamma/tau
MSTIEIDAASNTGVESIREVIEAAYTRAIGRFKIYIIDEVHMLSKSAFNALLKTLEEPPEHVKFILATTEPEKVLPTILSRCQRYDFRNIPTREIAEHLKSICKQEKIKADDDALLLVAKAGAGSMRDALSLLDRLLSVGEKHLNIEMIENLLGMPKTQVIFDLVEAIGGADVKQTLQISSKLIAGGLSAESLVAALVDHFRNLLILRTCGPDSDMVEVPGLSMQELQTQAGRFDAVALSQDIALLEELRRNLRSSQAGRALFDATLVRLALAEQFTQVATMLEGNGSPTAAVATAASASSSGAALKKNGEVNRTVEVKSLPPAPPGVPGGEIGADDDDDALPAPGKVWDNSGPSLAEMVKQQTKLAEESSNVTAVDAADFDGVMSRLRAAIHQKSPGIDGWLVHAKYVGVRDGVAVIRYASNHNTAATMLDRNGKREIIQDELCNVLGETVGVKFEVEEADPNAVDETPTQARPVRREAVRATPIPPSADPVAPSVRITPELREQLRNSEPLIKTLMDDLGAEIVKVE